MGTRRKYNHYCYYYVYIIMDTRRKAKTRKRSYVSIFHFIESMLLVNFATSGSFDTSNDKVNNAINFAKEGFNLGMDIGEDSLVDAICRFSPYGGGSIKGLYNMYVVCENEKWILSKFIVICCEILGF